VIEVFKSIDNKIKVKTDLNIIYSQTSDWMFSVITEDGTEEKFVILRNKSGDRWLELWGELEDYKALEELILDDQSNKMVERNVLGYKNNIKYMRNGCEFYLYYIEYVDPWIDPHWDGDPFIEFGFVEKGHPKFEMYVAEGLRLSKIIDERRKNKHNK